MSWLLIKISVPLPYVDAICEALETQGALSVTIEALNEEERFQSGIEATTLWSENRVIGLFPGETGTTDIVMALERAVDGRCFPYEFGELPEADWGRAWMVHYQPLQVAPRLWICPSWHEPPDPQAINLLLDPGLAFGTGTHPTTALCLRWLSEQTLNGRTVIDYGCGSGILSIASLKLGADRAIGLDIDPQALVVTRENAARNHVEARLQALEPTAISRGCTADIVVANILAEPLISLAPEIMRCVTSGGSLALSGLLTNQADEVASHYASQFALQRQEREGWVLLAGPRIY